MVSPTEEASPRISKLDRVVVYAIDIDRTIDFCTTVLGMNHVIFDGGYHPLQFGQQKINTHDAAAPFQPHAERPAPGGFDVCLLTDTPIPDVLSNDQNLWMALGLVT